LFGSIQLNTVGELHAGLDQRQQVCAIEAPPAELDHIEQLERHQQALGSGADAPGRAFAQAHDGQRRLDNVGGAQMLPVLGREVEEAKQSFPMGDKRLDRLGVLGLIFRLAAKFCSFAFGAGLGVHHFVQRALGAGL